MNKGLLGLFKDELGRKHMAKFVALIEKAYSYLDDVTNIKNLTVQKSV